MVTALLVIVILLLLLLWGVAYIAYPTPAAAGDELTVPVPAHTVAPDRLRIGTYNIHGGRGEDGRSNLGRVAQVIAGADLVALQEVHGPTHLGKADQASGLARTLGSGALFSPARTRWFRDYRGIALLSRLPVEHWRREPLPDSSGHSFRILTTARLRCNGRVVHVLHTHLHPRLSRAEQMRIVFERFRALSPAILLGDLNATREDPQIAELLHSGAAQDAIGDALGARDPADRIDWILTRDLHVHGGDMTEKGVSDHPYYWVNLTF
jgi:endonuclease/exonuclease/phosphatase family metal-dependent hydrolase